MRIYIYIIYNSYLYFPEGHSRSIFSVAMNWPLKIGAAGCEDTMVSTWDLETGLRLHTFIGHDRQVKEICVDWD